MTTHRRSRRGRLPFRSAAGWTAPWALLVAVLGIASGAFAADERAAAGFAEAGLPFLEKHCLDCHSDAHAEAELSFSGFRDDASLLGQRERWKIVIGMVETGGMPPEDSPQPTAEERDRFLRAVREVFERAARDAKPDPGRVTMRRLNRTEYRNTVRDLVGVDFDPTEDFPSDDIGHGFDNIGDVLTMSPVLMERYLAAAEANYRVPVAGFEFRALTDIAQPPACNCVPAR